MSRLKLIAIALGVIIIALLGAVACSSGSSSSASSTSTAAPTVTQTTDSSLAVQTMTAAPTATSAPTPTPTAEPKSTPTPTPKPTPTPTPKPKPTPTPTTKPKPTPTLQPTPTPKPSGPPLTPATVTRVVDGDTLVVDINGQDYKLRLIGMDTPETVDPSRPVMCFGHQATEETQRLVDQAGGKVLLEKDVSETDRYGRLLRFVWLVDPDGRRMLNEELVKGGYARAYTFPPDVRYADTFRNEEAAARSAHKGLWGSCSGFDVPVATQQAASTAAPTSAPTHASQVVPDNIDYDCKDFKTHAQAQAYFDSQGGSPSNDVDRLDSDHDGIACESLP